MPAPQRKTANLRAGRISAAGARYFITACTAHRQPRFVDQPALDAARHAINRLTFDGDVDWLVATVMPDHLHLLFETTGRLSLEQIVSKMKSLITRAIESERPIWQENIFEHRLRAIEDVETYAFYIFMNPYRAGLVAMNTCWPHWICTTPARFMFLDGLTENGVPPPEWLVRDETNEGTLVVGD